MARYSHTTGRVQQRNTYPGRQDVNIKVASGHDPTAYKALTLSMAGSPLPSRAWEPCADSSCILPEPCAYSYCSVRLGASRGSKAAEMPADHRWDSSCIRNCSDTTYTQSKRSSYQLVAETRANQHVTVAAQLHMSILHVHTQQTTLNRKQ